MPRNSRAPKRQSRRPANGRRAPRRKNNFKRKNVKKFVSARAPMVECKKRSLGVQQGLINPAIYFTEFPCRSFLEMTQGLDEDQMTGTSIFSKYYSMKVKLNFPTEHPIDENFRAQLVWGWRTAPLAVPDSIPAGFPAGTPTRTMITRDQINNMVIASVQQGFNQNVDQMNFRDKEKTIYKVIGKKWVKPDRRHQIGQAQGTLGYIDPDDDKFKLENVGSLPPWTHQITFKPMRKTKYTMGPFDGPNATRRYFPNESWIPWVGLYTPNLGSYYEDAGVVPDSAKITFASNDCHWFTDS